MKESLISYGAITTDFKVIAGLTKRMNLIKKGQMEQCRVDCYSIGTVLAVNKKFESLFLPQPKSIEIFYPSQNYPPHTDEGGISYFIALETGDFYIDNVTYKVTPFVLYAFDDGKLHNTNFCGIMLK